MLERLVKCCEVIDVPEQKLLKEILQYDIMPEEMIGLDRDCFKIIIKNDLSFQDRRRSSERQKVKEILRTIEEKMKLSETGLSAKCYYDEMTDTIHVFFYNFGPQGKRQIKGRTSLDIAKKPSRINLSNGRFLNTGQGHGLEYECALIALARKLGWKKYFFIASTSKEKGEIGAYPLARNGREFAGRGNRIDVVIALEKYCKQHDIKTFFLPNDPAPYKWKDMIVRLRRPIDFALLQGETESGERIADLGKRFLTEEDVSWLGKRTVKESDRGIVDFIKRLMEKGHADWAKKFCTDTDGEYRQAEKEFMAEKERVEVA